MLTLDEARRWAIAECDAWNRGDLEAILSRYSEQATVLSPAVITSLGRSDGELRGKAGIREYFALGLQTPGLHFELLDVLVGVKTLCMVFRGRRASWSATSSSSTSTGR